MARRLTADAKIVLERAGYVVEITSCINMSVYRDTMLRRMIAIAGGTVDNDEVVKLLNARGFDEFGVKRR